ncbi:hypothetical protein PVAG01_10496 [Phlyctema vagabunda]|uniref:Uncharacterized protein n=1 Tax=Phlyctema vagabunda TaxID=108571 RepID=A0ABR4P334_9HELO
MAENIGRNVELLVHVAAPSTGRDDARYRSFAAAFLAFEPCQRRSIHTHLQENPNLVDEAEESYKPIEDDDWGSTQYSTQYVVEEDSFDGSINIGSASDARNSSPHQNVGRILFPRVMASPELSFKSVMDNADSPVFRGLGYKRTMPGPGNGSHTSSQESRDSGSWHPPSRPITNSQDNYQSTKLFPSSPTRVLEMHLGNFGTETDISSSAPRRSGRIAARNASSSAPKSGPGQTIPSSIPEITPTARVEDEDKAPSDFNNWSLPMSFPSSTDSAQHNAEDEAVGLPLPPILVLRSDADAAPSSPIQNRPLPSTSDELIPKTSSGSLPQIRSLSEQPSAGHDTSSQSNPPGEATRSASAPAARAFTKSKSFTTENQPTIDDDGPSRKRQRSPSSAQVNVISSLSLDQVEIGSDLGSNSLAPASKYQRLEDNNLTGEQRPKPRYVLKSTPPLFRSIDTNVYPLEIHPPTPTTGMDELTPESLVTKTLCKLQSKPTLRGEFQPQQQTRPLRPLERGYWHVNWQLWTEEHRNLCWGFLAATVGPGGAGFGVWCTRDEDFRVFRVYCWGHIVEHIYLLIYIASRTKVRGTGARWIDGNETAVVVMPS